ncbi:MAG: hypothetical protein ACHQ6T_14260 [Myxococcota bacterium]
MRDCASGLPPSRIENTVTAIRVALVDIAGSDDRARRSLLTRS